MNKDLLEAYRKYVIDEFDQDIVEEDIKTTGLLGLAYTTYGDNDEIDIQISYDFVSEHIIVEINGNNGSISMKEKFTTKDMVFIIKGMRFQDWYSEYVELCDVVMKWVHSI